VDYEELLKVVKGSNEALEQINGQLAQLTSLQTSSAIDVPVTQGVAEAGSGQPTLFQRRVKEMAIRSEMRNVLRTKSTQELHNIFGMLLARKGQGIPFEMWAASGGQSSSIFSGFQMQAGQGHASDVNPDVLRALDTGGAAALIRTDLEPVLYELYVREFVAFDRLRREPANGLTHTYNQITSFGAAQFMSELGTVTDDTSVYARKTTNIAIVATRRGLSLKSQFAVAAGGMGYDPMDLELQGGLRAIALRMQTQIFSGQSTNSGGSASTEDGEYQPNGFDGLRKILNTARATQVDPLAAAPADDIRRVIAQAVTKITQSGGARPSILWGHPEDKDTFDFQQDKNIRYQNQFTDIGVGILTNSVNTGAGPLPFATVPGEAIGAYTPAVAFGGGDVRDLYILDESTISLPYLGSEGPTVLDIPIGISGQLTHLFIIFGMWGLAVKAIPFSNKVRIAQ